MEEVVDRAVLLSVGAVGTVDDTTDGRADADFIRFEDVEKLLVLDGFFTVGDNVGLESLGGVGDSDGVAVELGIALEHRKSIREEIKSLTKGNSTLKANLFESMRNIRMDYLL